MADRLATEKLKFLFLLKTEKAVTMICFTVTARL